MFVGGGGGDGVGGGGGSAGSVGVSGEVARLWKRVLSRSCCGV